MVKQISLTKGNFVTVDDTDYEYMCQWKWCVSSTGYAVRNANKAEKEAGSTTMIFMHRVLIGLDSVEVDHIDGDRLNNQRSNLRACSKQQNRQNTKTRSDNLAGYKGVSWSEHTKKWRVTVNINGKQKNIGYFKSEEDAAQAYNFAALEAFGEFARLNVA